MTEESIKCLLCGGTNTFYLAWREEGNRYGCKNCDTEFVIPHLKGGTHT